MFSKQMNDLFSQQVPFFFIINFAKTSGDVIPLNELNKESILFATPDFTNAIQTNTIDKALVFEKNPETFNTYKQRFNIVHDAIKRGNSYLANLTCETPVNINCTLKELFHLGKGKYKLWYKDSFVHFSPETFVRIENGKIFSNPMKGTLDASLPNAEVSILNDKKEAAEHYTIVDLIRNDLSLVANNVDVTRFRYIEKIRTHSKDLLQVSSEISGNILPEYQKRPGDIFAQLLPAGSISGAPKEKTIEILHTAEGYERGFYTGVWGVYDGNKIDSCVMIRFIERTEDGLVFKSGGGITALSNSESEYQEMIDKIYVPVY